MFYHHWNLVTANQIPGISGRFSGRYFLSFEDSSRTNIVKIVKFPNQLAGLAGDEGENCFDN
ncbi:MAG TPA: hypothetical protein VEC37_17460 [Bacillota bacterium]|nr:hypothetical protein [Bacillota bacterium]